MPPTWLSDSKTMGLIFERASSSSAAVRPAGPAPAITATFSFRSIAGIPNDLSSGRMTYKQDLTAGNKIARKSKPRCHTLGQQVMQAQILHHQRHHSCIDPEADGPDCHEADEFYAPIAQAML